MVHTTTNRAARLAIALGMTAALLGAGSGAALAGEITGNGTLKTVHGRSDCAYSGQEDLQFFYDNEDTMPKAVPTRGDPGHAQSWGQIDKATRAVLTSIGLNPGIACNPTKASGGE
jgi:hypothetical protein